MFGTIIIAFSEVKAETSHHSRWSSKALSVDRLGESVDQLEGWLIRHFSIRLVDLLFRSTDYG